MWMEVVRNPGCVEKGGGCSIVVKKGRPDRDGKGNNLCKPLTGAKKKNRGGEMNREVLFYIEKKT